MPNIDRPSRPGNSCILPTPTPSITYSPPSCPLDDTEVDNLKHKVLSYMNFKIKYGIFAEYDFIDDRTVLEKITDFLDNTPADVRVPTEEDLNLLKLCKDRLIMSEFEENIINTFNERLNEWNEITSGATIPFILTKIGCEKSKGNDNILGGGDSEYDFINSIYPYLSGSFEDEFEFQKQFVGGIEDINEYGSMLCRRAADFRVSVPIGIRSSIESLIEDGTLSPLDLIKLSVNPNIKDLFLILTGENPGFVITPRDLEYAINI